MIEVANVASTVPAQGTESTGAAGAVPAGTDGFLALLQQMLGGGEGGTVQELLTGLASGESATSAEQLSETISGLLGDADLPEELGSDDQASALDPDLASRLAGWMQTMGFQVRPQDLTELSSLDAGQLSSALEFIDRGLSSGASAEDVLENASLLLPRNWSFQGLDASPEATLEAGEGLEDSPDFQAALENLQGMRQELSEALEASGAAMVVPAQTAAAGDASALSTSAESLRSGLRPGSPASELIGRQVIEKVHVQLAQGRREVTVRLWPEELGEVRLSMRMSQTDKVEARIVVENESVRQAMLDATPQMKEVLARHGLDLETLAVSVDPGGGQASAGSGDGDGSGSQRDRRGERGWREAEILVDDESGQPTGSVSVEGLHTIDLWS